MSRSKGSSENGHAGLDPAGEGTMGPGTGADCDDVKEQGVAGAFFRNSEKIIRTAIMCTCFICMGLCFGIWNGTLVDLEKMMNTNTQMISTVFTCRGVGSIISMCTLTVLLDKFNAMLVVGCCLVLSAFVTASVPWAGSLPVLMTLGAFKGTFIGLSMVGEYRHKEHKSFVVKYLGWAKPTAAGLVTLYSASQAVGRLTAIFTSKILTPNKILIIDFTLGLISMGVLLLAIDTHFIVIWVCTGIAGYATSTLYTCAVTWMNKLIVVTGRVLGFFTLGVPVGYMTIPLLTGTLMTKVDLKWFLYMCFACWIGNTLIHVVISIFVNRHEKQKSHHQVARSIKDLEGWHDQLTKENTTEI